jgi:hypothetical protein
MIEIWRDIKGYEGLYQISNLGRVKSLYFKKELILKPSINSKGYCSIVLYNNSKRTVTVHSLVAKTFLDNPNNLPMVNHKDEIKTNNKVDNLEWCDVRYNNNYGNRNIKIRDSHSKAIVGININNNLIEYIFSSSVEANKNGFSGSCIRKCCRNERQTHKGYYWRNLLC